jgi:hypothetical protein
MKPVKIVHQNNFIDIAATFDTDISVSLSVDGIYYVWGSFYDHFWSCISSIPKETKFGSFNEIFLHFSKKTYLKNDEIIKFEDLFFRNGYFDQIHEVMEELGRGSFGLVFKAKLKTKRNTFAIKKIKSNTANEKEIIEEFLRYSIIYKIKSVFLVKYYDAWFEYINDRNNNLLLYIKWNYATKH